jgi:hypothetical protein
VFARTAEIVELLLTVGYVDGLFHHKEHAYIRRYMESVRGLVAGHNGVDLEATFTKLAREVAVLGEEVRASGSDAYVPTRLKVRAVTLFRSFPPAEQTGVLELVRGLMHADGLITQPEKQIYEELIGYFTGPPTPRAAATTATEMQAAPSTTGKPLILQPAQWLDLQALWHPVLDPLEQTYSPHPVERKSQIDLDYQHVQQAMAVWDRQRAAGNGRLSGVTDIARFPAGTKFLDQHVYVMRPAGGVEVIVLGDLRGCYGCL